MPGCLTRKDVQYRLKDMKELAVFVSFGKTVLSLILALGIARSADAADIAVPTGAPILTISGDITTPNVGDALVFDAQTFAALGSVTIETSTIWTEGVHTFEGVPLKTLVELVGVESGQLLASAINDYTVEVPVSEAVENGPIVAYLFNGEPMSVRDKGPLWIIYPYDQNAEYRSEVTYTRSIWQLDRIEVVR
jgi:hypothetical protein